MSVNIASTPFISFWSVIPKRLQEEPAALVRLPQVDWLRDLGRNFRTLLICDFRNMLKETLKETLKRNTK